MDRKQRRENLRKLGEALTTFVPPEGARFDLTTWADADKGKQYECGYAGCAVGWAQHLVPACGISLHESKFTCGVGSWLVPYFDGEHGWDAVKAAFDLDLDQSVYLFEAMSYGGLDEDGEEIEGFDARAVTPREVGERILEFVRNNPVEDGGV